VRTWPRPSGSQACLQLHLRRNRRTILEVYDFGWDGDHRLRSLVQGGVTTFTARYDGSGLRRSKWDSATGQHDFTWGLGGVLKNSNGSTVYTPGLAERKNGSDTFYHSDWLGSTRYLSDDTGNSFPHGLRYDAYGRKTAKSGSDWNPSSFQFAGAWGYQSEAGTDVAPGLQYLEQRYYDPQVGRFLTPDPIGFAGGLNLYAYCANDPVNAVDPSGLIPVETIWDFGVVAVDIGVLAWDRATGAPPEVIALDTAALTADLVGLFVPYLPSGGGRGMAFAGRAVAFAKASARVPVGAGATANALGRGTYILSSSQDINLLPAQHRPAPPNPNGKRGCPAHQSKVSALEAQFRARRWTHESGGSRAEKAVDVGGRRMFPDLVFTKGDTTIAIQVGKANKNGTPVARERRNRDALKGSGNFNHVRFFRYN
jgi:RHS repeat-associated protein